MKASKVIARLESLIKEYGDMEVFMDTNPDHLHPIGEIDVDAEDTGIIIWPLKDVIAPLARDNSVLVNILSLVGITVDEATVSTWTDEQYWQAIDWSTAAVLEASDHNDIEVPPMPDFLEQYR